ncbi:chitinase [Aliivibrio fischeri]|uniref:glycosyl hydrolase family 18 protein n=1 Tax=Aliivibrio fischeri TaxID=668 RepID=UPI0012D91159|nr:glycosyl hydrolase family 18 protein [Aliivibrio fischeri]MUK63298.1 chitinase [Aliivibrio fischeri]MUL20085.1 chitinase [Aliivibrio fischeri]MUL24948.1 chitinase [Aliivibrio fischeri]
MFKKKLGLCSAAVTLALSAPTFAAPPGQAIISWMETDFSIIEIDQAATSYKSLVTVKDFAEVPVTWDRWSGEPAEKWRVLLNGVVVHEEAVSPAASQKASTTLQVRQGGQYEMTVQLCNGSGAAEECSTSDPKSIVVADTDGSHLDPLPMNIDPANGNYTTPAGMVSGAYFVEWGVYGRKFAVDQIPAQNLTHILYGFIPICGPNPSLGEIENGNSLAALNRACAGTPDYEVVIHDPWAAIQMPQPQSGHVHSTPYKGTYGQMMALKQRYPDLKIVPSIGGWTLSDPFYNFVDKSKRDIFVASVKKFLKTWKFYDGVDIDWEFPGGDGASATGGDPVNDGPAYVALMQELRAMLDELSAETGKTYELTSAIGAGYDKIEDVDYAAASQYMDYIFAMTYDFYGGWNNVVGHQTALNCGSHMSQGECDGTGLDDKGEPRKGPAYTITNAIDLLLAQGVDAKKLVVGAAMYARGWTGVTRESMTDPTNPMTGVGNGKVAGSWEAGVIDYKDVVTRYVNKAGVEVGYDEIAQAAYAYDPSNGDLVTYDNKKSVLAKGEYVRSLGLGGLFAWEIDADNGDILNAMQEGLAGDGTVTPPANKKPVANAGVDVSVIAPASVQLDGSLSSDSDGSIVSYAWTQVSGPNVTLGGADSVNPSFATDTFTQSETLQFTLTVTDDKGATASDSVAVSVTVEGTEPVNTPPVAVIVAPTSVNKGDVVTLDASTSTDADNDPLTYSWVIPTGVDATVVGSKVTFTAGSYTVDTPFTFSVTANDGQASDTANVTVTVLKDAGEPPVTCDNAWDASTVYTGGDQVSQAGKVWEAKWWTKGDEPSKSGEWGVWKEVGISTCN